MKKDILLFLLYLLCLVLLQRRGRYGWCQNKETENKEIKIILEAETSSQNIFAPIVFYQSFDFGKDAPCLSRSV